jgi:membrane-associated HD superfamily phosphohydrolase
MDLNDISKDLGDIKMPQQRRERMPNFKIKNGKLKANILRIMAFFVLLLVTLFGYIVITHYQTAVMALIVIVYLIVGAYLAFKIWTLSYTGWLYLLYLVVAAALLSLLTLFSRGFSNFNLATGSLVALIVSIAWAAALWWIKDLFGIRKTKEIFEPYK